MLIKLALNIPTLLLNPNPWRKKFSIQMQIKSVDANNTGKIFIGIGKQPVAVVGHASQGEVLMQGAVMEKPRTGETLRPFEQMTIWAISDTANQTIVIEEIIEEPELK